MNLWPPRKPRPNDWSHADTESLRSTAGRVPTRIIAVRLGRTRKAVWAHATVHHIPLAARPNAPARYGRWSSTEIGHLRLLSRTHTRAEAAAVLGRTPRSVAWQAGRSRISFVRYGERHERTCHPPATLRNIVAMQAQGYSARATAQALHLRVDYVFRIRSRSARWRETMMFEEGA